MAEDPGFPHNTPISYDAIFLIDFSGWDIGRMLLMEEVSDAESLFNSFPVEAWIFFYLSKKQKGDPSPW